MGTHLLVSFSLVVKGPAVASFLSLQLQMPAHRHNRSVTVTHHPMACINSPRQRVILLPTRTIPHSGTLGCNSPLQGSLHGTSSLARPCPPASSTSSPADMNRMAAFPLRRVRGGPRCLGGRTVSFDLHHPAHPCKVSPLPVANARKFGILFARMNSALSSVCLSLPPMDDTNTNAMH
ncbi:LOW QUALITY PROTEIN: hypothetical protein PHMEG_0007026 [Phytophthora megakarya]|uniref:Secreted protein n=1 Tax=Phytophthora megakarya TaxID=4795 RepID=A0A225WNZ2_9STRA|nr:LOW QUALITY PROTEIN: hypothetical protein PHMEG_0007026 [Phytophthora megakarya]